MAAAASSSSIVSTSNPNKPHVMCIPYPIQGHINPMLKLASILHSLGFHITFVNTEFIHNNLLKSGALKSFSNLPNFWFEIVPNCLPPLLATSGQDYYYYLLCQFARKKFLPSLHHLITRLNWCKTVTCIVSDGLMPFNMMIARELGIPGYLLWVPNACAFMGYLQEKGVMPPKDRKLDMVLDLASGLKNIRLNDLPMREAEEAFQASGIIFDTFEALEQGVFDVLKPMFQHVYAIGPLQMLLNSTFNRSSDHLKAASFSPYGNELNCLEWLNSMKPNSVVYISFGDLVVMTPQQLCEFAWGICNSNHPFLWIIRPDFVKGQLATLPPEFLEKTKDRGLIAPWCPQKQVLTHPSVGVFVTQFGAQTLLESICAGVPMIGWPYYGDNQESCRYSCNHWGIGMKINEDTKREEVEWLVRESLEGDKGKEMKRNVMEWKKLAVEATSQGGSSEKCFDNLVKALSGSQNFMAATNRRNDVNVEVVVTSRDNIKPSIPTPLRLRHLPLSFFDRIVYRVFVPMIFFYSKVPKKDDIIKATNLETSIHLKKSLAETLVKCYPLAGRVKEFHTECNDQGVPYFEAQAKCQLSQVVGESCLAKLNKLLPYGEQAGDLALAIQVSFFYCGGIAIGVCLNHKIADASSMSSFVNYWARIARGDHPRNMNLICPRFDSAKLFPPVENQISDGTTNCSTSARRFVFSASALSAMKSKYAMPTSRAEALSAFIWTRVLAAGEGKDAGSATPLLALYAVDLRTRMDPPLSEYHIGNLAGFPRVGSSMDSAMEDDSVFIKMTRDAIARVDDKFIKNLQKAEFAYHYLQTKINEHESSLYFSSLFKFPLYEADFGWGRPIWVTMSGLFNANTLVFMPTRSGEGAEVLVYLNEDDMAKLEADREFLEFVSPPLGVKNQFLSSL